MPVSSLAASDRGAPAESFDVVIVGAGFAGLYGLYRLRGMGLSVRVFEQGGDVGGTWYWNRYPGARCDVESVQYSYSFSDDLQQEWNWSERYAPQPEILSYAQHVAERFDLRRDIRFDTRVERAVFDDAANCWRVTTSDGATVSATHVILATGCLSNARVPDFPGQDAFRGKTYHTGHWPHEGVDFTGLRVGVIGTGSSAIQAIPLIAEQASQLYVFQRTPNFSVPAYNRKVTEDEQRHWKANYAELRHRARYEMRNGIVMEPAERGAFEDSDTARQARYTDCWSRGGIPFMAAYNNLLTDLDANETAAGFVRDRIAETVADPQVARLLQPVGYPIGAKRICVDTDYYKTFNRPNVTLVDVRSTPIERLTADGVQAGGTDYALDAVVFATGFDAMTGSVAKIEIAGRDGTTLNDKWAAGPRTYLGLMSANFPNLYIVTGPGSPSVLSNMIVSIEQHIDMIADALAHLRAHGLDRIEPLQDAEDRWVDHVNEVAYGTVYPQANSWYMGANVPGKPRIFMPYIGGVGAYRRICEDVVARGYEGFALSSRTATADAAE